MGRVVNPNVNIVSIVISWHPDEKTRGPKAPLFPRPQGSHLLKGFKKNLARRPGCEYSICTPLEEVEIRVRVIIIRCVYQH